MIEKGVPIPRKAQEIKARKGNKFKYPWRLCVDVGDSFIPKEKDIKKVLESAKKFCQRNKEFRFKVYMIDGVIRVWRVANDSQNT